ncbi:DNA-directed RNA polymerase subunit alpha [Candidatus Magnetominusculus dajiuhuensis]|uniref:DNA-directed RNA polymerase subunit alpha n=1 Tax=Candidatus Magnetominusculus dajiuhuensis TaxID=3137712 RepID=UPI003B428C24
MLLENSGFQLPENVYFEEETFTDTYGRLIAEPLERGYGITIGNALRRVLLSSIEGAAITSVKFEGVYHEFSTIKGVKEDVVQIVLNLKKLRFRLHGDEELNATIDVSGSAVVAAKDIKASARLEMLNPDAHIATLDRDSEFKVELRINKGRGYIPSEEMPKEGMPLGTITIDAIFTPIRKVIFNVEKTRVGKATDYDKLLLEIWTDGSIDPKAALAKATKILTKHMSYFSLIEVVEEEVEEEDKEDAAAVEDSPVISSPEPVEPNVLPGKEFNRNLLKTVDELEFSVRSQNCLKNADIKYIYELVQRNDHEMLKMKNFGRKSLDEIREVLLTLGLDFNVKIDMDAVRRELKIENGGG